MAEPKKKKRASVYLAYGKNIEKNNSAPSSSLTGKTKELYEKSGNSFADLFETVHDGHPQTEKTDQPDDHPLGQSHDRSDSQSLTQPVGQSVKEIHPHNQSDVQSLTQSVGQLHGQSVNHPPDRPPEEKTVSLKECSFETYPEFCITEKQAGVLAFLCTRKRNFTNRKIIKEATGIALGTVKDAVSLLKEKGFIHTTRLKRYGRQPGFEYSLNRDLCERYFREFPDYINHPPDQPVDHPLGQSLEPLSSSSVSLQETTTAEKIREHRAQPEPAPEIEQIKSALAAHPELGYWRQKNLTAKQVQEWMNVAGCGLETMIQHLCWCRFDMVDQGLETSKPIKNVFNWFFRIIEKTGGYPRPETYKSFIERQIEEEQRLADEQQKQIERLKALRRDKWERQRELEFWQMMNEPEGALYQQCFERLSRFDKQRAKKGGKAFEAAMRKRFDEAGEG